MNRLILPGVFCMLLAMNACMPEKQEIPGLWFFSGRTDMILPADSSVTAASFLDLRTDGSYTRDFGVFDTGHWQRKDSILILKPSHRSAVNIDIIDFAGNGLDLQVNDRVIVSFARMPGKFSGAADNPFAGTNNQWRIPAKAKENEAQLKKRLRDHCSFFVRYFNWGITDGLPAVDVRSTPSLIKIYRNGFKLRPYEDLPAAWKAYFYDEEDCRKANDIMKDIFEHHDIEWKDTDNRYKMFMSAFQQLADLLR